MFCESFLFKIKHYAVSLIFRPNMKCYALFYVYPLHFKATRHFWFGSVLIALQSTRSALIS
jgi:hypothetical protein